MVRKHLRFLLLSCTAWLISLPSVAAVILQYHHISDSTPSSTSTSVERFEQHLKYLKQHQYRVMALPELISRLQQGQLLDDKTVVITFDDGYRSVYDNAFDLLKKFNFKFTVFVNSAPIDRGSPEFVTWPELKQMAQAGATIANHTASHPYMVRLLKDESQSQWRKRITAEITDTEQAIKKHTGQSVKLLAYPYGESNQALEAVVQKLGYIGIGQHSGAVGPGSDFLSLPRFPMGGNYSQMDDFITKVQTRALPIKKHQLLSDSGKVITQAVVAAGAKPRLQLTLSQAAIAAQLTCYMRGDQLPLQVQGATVTVATERALTPGRAQYNCTARADDGRYYWYSQAWLITGEQGQWQHQN